MKITPILMQGDMVRATLRETEHPGTGKSQTRRLRGLDEVNGYHPWEFVNYAIKNGQYGALFNRGKFNMFVACPYGGPGDLLWVRETFVLENTHEYHGMHETPTDGRPVQEFDDADYGKYCLIPHYRATEPEPNIVSYEQDEDDDRTRWSPAIHMKRWASRLTLELSRVLVQRVQDISTADAIAEGVMCKDLSEEQKACGPSGLFEILWRQINEHKGWDRNPLVWVLEFKPIRMNVDELLRLRAEYSDDKIPWSQPPKKEVTDGAGS